MATKMDLLSGLTETLAHKSQSLIILGLGDGAHILELLTQFPNLELTIIDPRKELLETFVPPIGSTIRYIHSLEGVQALAQSLSRAELPIPVVSFSQCWYPHKIFFDWAHHQLIDPEAPTRWNKSDSAFILRSLFV
jgi:hypothetical protein